MSQYLAFIILFCLAVLQTTVMPRVTVMGVHPNLVLMAVTSWSLLRGAEEGMLWALVGGLAMDLFSGAPLGVCALALLAVSFLSGLGERNVFRLELLIPILAIPVATLVYQLIVLGLLALLGWRAEWGAGLSRVVFPSMVVNTLGMPAVYLAARLLDHRLGREEITL
jgi:rod shape-determining protein MreD